MERLPNIHPGELLREDYVIPLGMSSYRLAKELGMSQTAVGEILHGKRAITPATALRLARFFGSTAEFWLHLQAAYDLEEERKRMGDLLAGVQPAILKRSAGESYAVWSSAGSNGPQSLRRSISASRGI